MRLIEISAWNDSGGGFLNRLLDGHPRLDAWPYELLLGADGAAVGDRLGEDWFRGRFRWPRLPSIAGRDGADLFDAIADSELKAVLRDPAAAKHAAFPVAVDLAAWRARVAEDWGAAPEKTQGLFLSIYLSSFFALWRGRPLDAGARVLGHCPVAILDAPELWHDFPDARIVHVVRRPEAGFHDMRRRHADLDPARYAAKWNLVNGFALALAAKAPGRVRLVALDDLLQNRDATLRALCDWLEIGFDDAVLTPTWCGMPIDPAAMGPFGGVPFAVAEVERRLPDRLTAAERAIIGTASAGTRALLAELHGILPGRDSA